MVAGFVWQFKQLVSAACAASAPAPNRAIISKARAEVAVFTMEPPCAFCIKADGPGANAPFQIIVGEYRDVNR
jgi:hypothetical protein